MKALLREFAPTSIFALIVITLMGITLSTLNTNARTNGIQHAEIVGNLNLVEYRLDRVERALNPPSVAFNIQEDDDGS